MEHRTPSRVQLDHLPLQRKLLSLAITSQPLLGTLFLAGPLFPYRPSPIVPTYEPEVFLDSTGTLFLGTIYFDHTKANSAAGDPISPVLVNQDMDRPLGYIIHTPRHNITLGSPDLEGRIVKRPLAQPLNEYRKWGPGTHNLCPSPYVKDPLYTA